MENTEMVAAEFPASRSNDYRKQGREQAREPARDKGRERGRDQGREWQTKKIRTDGLPPMSIEQQLEAPCPNHMFYDDNGVRRSSHKLKDCRRFQLLAEATLRQQQAAQRAGYPMVPGRQHSEHHLHHRYHYPHHQRHSHLELSNRQESTNGNWRTNQLTNHIPNPRGRCA